MSDTSPMTTNTSKTPDLGEEAAVTSTTVPPEFHGITLYDTYLNGTVLPSFFLVEAAAIILSNLSTIAVVLRSRYLRQVKTNVLIIYLSLADLLIGPSLGYLSVFVIFRLRVIPRLHALCGVWFFCVSIRVSVLMLTLIGVDRLVAVWRPLGYHRIVTRRRVHVAAMVTWVYVATVVGGVFVYGISQSESSESLYGHPGDFLPAGLYRGFLLPHFYVPVLINCALYAAIFILLHRQGRRVRTCVPGAPPGGVIQREMRRQKFTRKMMKMMTEVLGVEILTLTPFAIVATLYSPNDPDSPSWHGTAYLLSMLVQYSSSCINPVIYCWQSPEWRKGYVSLLGGWKVRGRADITQTGTLQEPNPGQATHM